MANRRLLSLLSVSLFLLFASFADATVIVMPSDDALIAKSPVIIEGLVLKSEPVERDGGIWTETVLSVQRAIKGDAGPTVTIREVGGQIGDRTSIVFGSPEYTAGEHVLVFLWPTPRGDYQTRDLFVGKFSMKHSRDGRSLWYRDEVRNGTTLLDGKFQPIADAHIQRDADLFEDYVDQRAHGRHPVRRYEVQNATIGSGQSFTSDFTMISEPSIYRWFAFERGSTAKWYSYGTQPGYTGGGVSELRTGMAAWTSYSSALIKYSYAGTGSGAPSGLSAPNGVNEVVFNDPMNEIDGSWNPSTGGVVGRGGFNNVSGSYSWTSPFAGDASHPQKTYSGVGNISEGNLVIQDNVSPGTRISSSVLAAIIAHELGHTLGFGHSADSTALMYPTISAGGATLRTDDQMAARWLYPNGSAPAPTVPAAPTGLVASAVSSTQASLSWTDNATNETSETVYVAPGSGAFSVAGNVGAGTKSYGIGGLTAGQTYRFKVTASNSAGESPSSNIAQVTMPASATIHAGFTVTPSSGTAGVTTFVTTDQSTGSIASRSWTFGDGATSTALNPTHVYASAGTFTITLTVRNSSGASSSVSHTVSVGAPAPSPSVSANFTFSPASATAGQTVAFYDQSTGGVTSWRWTFGDGSSSTAKNPSHAYAAAGNYTVTLAVSNGSTSSSTARTISVAAVTPGTPSVSASFNYSPAAPSVGQAVVFADASTGSPTSWSWNFGDGQSSSAQNPSHAFAASGNYSVTLTARNSGSSSASTRVVTVASSIGKFSSLVPVSAQTTGAGSSYWRTELTIFNASPFSANVDFVFLPNPGGTPMSRSTVILANRSVTWDNVLRDLFGLTSSTGAIGIQATNPAGTPDLRVSSRTFTTADKGTYGQFVPDVATSIPAKMYITGIDSNAQFRTNVGFVNRSDAAVSSNVTLLDSGGGVIATRSVSFPPKSFQQYALSSLFSALSAQSKTGMSMVVQSSMADAVTSYASVIDNRTQDPVFLPASGAATGGTTIIPAVARLGGAAGTYWRSDVSIFNPTGSPMNVAVRLWAADRDNRGAGAKTFSLGPSKSVRIADVMTWLGAGDGKGALVVSSSGAPANPVVTSRTYTTRTSDGGTYGQGIDGVAASRFASDDIVTGLRSDFTNRANIGFVNTSAATAGVTVTLVAESGVRSSAFITVPANSQTQPTLAGLFPSLNAGTLGNFTIRAHTDSGAVLFTYGSVIDDDSGDPIFIGGN